MTIFNRFVKWAGGPAKAIKKLKVSEELVYKMMTGERGISKKTALKINKLDPALFPLRKLLFKRPKAA